MVTKRKRVRTGTGMTPARPAGALTERRAPNLPTALLADIAVLCAARGIEPQVWMIHTLEAAVRMQLPAVATKLAARAKQITGNGGNGGKTTAAPATPAGYPAL